MVDRADGKHLVFLGCKGYRVEGYRVHDKRVQSGFTGLSRSSALSGAYRVWETWRRLLLLLLAPTLLPLMLLRCWGQLMPLLQRPETRMPWIMAMYTYMLRPERAACQR